MGYDQNRQIQESWGPLPGIPKVQKKIISGLLVKRAPRDPISSQKCVKHLCPGSFSILFWHSRPEGRARDFLRILGLGRLLYMGIMTVRHRTFKSFSLNRLSKMSRSLDHASSCMRLNGKLGQGVGGGMQDISRRRKAPSRNTSGSKRTAWNFPADFALYKERRNAINLSNLGKFGQISPPGNLFMLGRLAVPKIIYVRPVGSPENTSNIGENPNINNLMCLGGPSP